MAPWVINCCYSGSWAHQADAEHSNDHYNWLQWKRLLFKYISKCTVNWAKVQLHLCIETASGFIRSDRLCSLNLGFICVSWMLLWPLLVREEAEPGRRGAVHRSSSWRMQVWVKARQWRGGSSHSQHNAFPKISYLYLTSHVTPLKTVFLSEPKQDLWERVSASQTFTQPQGNRFFALYELLDCTVQTPLHTLSVSDLFDWRLLLPHFILSLQNMKFLCCAIWTVECMAYCWWVWYSHQLGFPAWGTSVSLILYFLWLSPS